MVDKRAILEHGLAQNLKIYLDSLDDQSYERELKNDPFLSDMAKATGYERKH